MLLAQPEALVVRQTFRWQPAHLHSGEWLGQQVVWLENKCRQLHVQWRACTRYRAPEAFDLKLRCSHGLMLIQVAPALRGDNKCRCRAHLQQSRKCQTYSLNSGRHQMRCCECAKLWCWRPAAPPAAPPPLQSSQSGCAVPAAAESHAVGGPGLWQHSGLRIDLTGSDSKAPVHLRAVS